MFVSFKDLLNIFIFIITLYITYSYITSSLKINNISTILFIYSFLDCYNSKIDIIIHHILVMLMVSMIKIYNINDNDCFLLGYQLLKVEISTLFLKIIRIFEYIKKRTDNKIILYMDKFNSYLFLISFIYLRLIDYPYTYFFNKNFWSVVERNNIAFISNIIAFIFISLNLYWLYCIYKKL